MSRTPEILPFHEQALPALLERQARIHGQKTLIRAGENSLSFADAPEVASRYAGKLVASGVKAGDRVAVMWPNRIELLQLWLGAMWMGAVLVPVNTAFRGEQLRHLLASADPVVLVTEGRLLSALSPAADVLKQLRHVWFTGQRGAEDVLELPNGTVSAWTVDGEPIPPHEVDPGKAAAILYTSGTSGPSKGVVCPHAQFYWWGVLNARALEINSHDVLHTSLPFFHTNALNTLWQGLVTGAAYSFVPRFSASRFWDEVKSSSATITYLLGSMIHILLKQPRSGDPQGHQLRTALSPATPIEMVDEFRKRFGVKLIEGYGSTETNLVFSNVNGSFAPGTMGRPFECFDVRLVDQHDCDVEQGSPGELVIRGSEPFSMASGYFGNPEATVAAWRNLWFHTGDLVTRDSDGVYHFLDRIKDSIRRRGENISSWEVENALVANPAIENAAVIGVPSELGEQEVMAFVVLRQGKTLEPVTLIRYLEPHLAYFAIPRYLEFVAELPLTENGKVRKYELKNRGIGAETWDREKAGVVLSRR